ncbi:hypothetical protein THAOC_17296 [Thalassiosira oceanica]|uniref:Coenzyme Q-binding protein COQ10 START domain-containing protein n=1 Tax=Thalassiosira oceanica TaxID=159749 RepID=K0SA27_THAOC|nr:hypothetical protein THAOC_17296 [Thalassiosira oceanica]|eukprot:EJK62105.1 hypothetical protein THAOC_17296 [Thalassiosira oceanica]
MRSKFHSARHQTRRNTPSFTGFTAISAVGGSVTVHYSPSTRIAPSRNRSSSHAYTQFYKQGVLVGIETTGMNSRRITGEVVMDAPLISIWNILKDYDSLSHKVPNLIESKITNPDAVLTRGALPRVYQRGAQVSDLLFDINFTQVSSTHFVWYDKRIFGFEFGADVTMDMRERCMDDRGYIDFKCVDSQFFQQFDGSWTIERLAESRTMVTYTVDVRPKGPVPVSALEWRIKEDVPSNMMSVGKAARQFNSGEVTTASPEQLDVSWYKDETLEAYL